jgi:acyl carrier protein
MDLEQFLVDFVVEQTGYPPEMVELDADLEADLGIDSIKKAQLFGELAEQFSISVDVTDENLSLDDFPTLRHVMNFLSAKGSASPTAVESKPSPSRVTVSKPQETPRPVAPPQVASVRPSANGTGHAHKEPELTKASALSQEDLEEFLVNFVVEQTGYPPEMVELDADLEADLGIDSIKKAQMMGELAEQFSISVDVTDENLSLDDFPTLRHVCNFLAGPAKAAV